MIITSYILMTLAGVGMLWSNRVHKRAKRKAHVPWARPFAGFCGAIALGLALANLWATMLRNDGPDPEAMRAWDLVQCDYLGQYLGEHAQGRRALIIHEPVNEYNHDLIQMRMEALKAGLGGRVEIGAATNPRPTKMGEDENGVPLYDDQPTAETFDAVIRQHPDCNLIISLIGLPVDFQRMDLWRQPREKMPDVALLNAPLFELKKAIQHGLVDVVVAYKPVQPVDAEKGYVVEPPPKNLDVAFHQRYLLAHAGNVNDLAKSYRGLFPD